MVLPYLDWVTLKPSLGTSGPCQITKATSNIAVTIATTMTNFIKNTNILRTNRPIMTPNKRKTSSISVFVGISVSSISSVSVCVDTDLESILHLQISWVVSDTVMSWLRAQSFALSLEASVLHFLQS